MYVLRSGRKREGKLYICMSYRIDYDRIHDTKLVDHGKHEKTR